MAARAVRGYGLPTAIVLTACQAVGCGGMSRTDNQQGVRLYQQGNYRAAVDHFQQALARQPGNPDCFYNLGATYHQQAKLFGRPADLATAEQYYHLCLARNPTHDACQRALAVLLVEEQRPAEAVAGLNAWARLVPTNPAPHVELARLAQERGDFREAENQLIDALHVAPNDARALVALGHLREVTGRPQEALDNYSRALALDAVQPTVAARAQALAAVPPGYRTASLPPSPVALEPAGTAATAPGMPAR